MTRRAFGAALSEHPLTTHATGEVVGAVLEQVGASPDLALVFVSAAHRGALEDVAATIGATLDPGTLLGCAATSVLGGDREVEDHPAIVLWAGRLGTTTPVRIDGSPAFPGEAPVSGLDEVGDDEAVLLLADPFTFPATETLATIAERSPGAALIGGLASAASGPGGNRLVLDDRVVTDGAVGVRFPADRLAGTVVAQGCRPIGQPFTVTRAERNVIYELGGRPALERLSEILDGLDPDTRALATRGLHLGQVVDEHRAEFRRGDFLIRAVLGADRAVGSVAAGDLVEVGRTVQFQVRDATSADADLRELLHGQQADAALVFTCNGRGMGLFGEPDHDAALVAAVAPGATAGMFCAGEFGPVGGRPFLHGFTASVALFR